MIKELILSGAILVSGCSAYAQTKTLPGDDYYRTMECTSGGSRVPCDMPKSKAGEVVWCTDNNGKEVNCEVIQPYMNQVEMDSEGLEALVVKLKLAIQALTDALVHQ